MQGAGPVRAAPLGIVVQIYCRPVVKANDSRQCRKNDGKCILKYLAVNIVLIKKK